MKRLVLALLLAAMWPGDARAAEPLPVPTIPQVPPPGVHQDAPVVPAAGAAGRVLGPLRDRMGLAQPVNRVSEQVATVPVDPGLDPIPCSAGGRACGSSIVLGSPIKSWLFFRPTTGHELPWLRPHPYVGPIAGQFPCSPTACQSCAGAPACAPGGGCGKGFGGLGLAGRGCGNGVCIPPSDDAFAGYKFATPLAPNLGNRGVSTSTSYKPAVAPTGAASGTAPQAAPRTGTVLDSLKRTVSKP